MIKSKFEKTWIDLFLYFVLYYKPKTGKYLELFLAKKKLIMNNSDYVLFN